MQNTHRLTSYLSGVALGVWAIATAVGYWTAIDGTNVNFLLFDGRTVSSQTLQRVLAAHLFFGGVTAVAVLLPVLHRLRNRLARAR